MNQSNCLEKRSMFEAFKITVEGLNGEKTGPEAMREAVLVGLDNINE